MHTMRTIIVVFIITMLSSCATGSAITTGNVRPAIDVSEVRILLNSPAQYEIIGIVEASSAVEFSRQAAQDRTINELRRQAARIGANGVILTSTGDTVTGGQFIGGVFKQVKQ